MNTNNIQYIGEHLGLKMMGESFIILALVTSLLSFIFYLVYNNSKKKSLLHTARWLYIGHFVAILGASIALYIALFGQYYEFSYVWEHTASYLDTKYIISAFWAGQEGSFLLWAIFEGLLGLIVLKTSGRNESYIIPTVSIIQFFLTSMTLGAKVGNFILGQNPFQLLRLKEVNVGAELFKDPNYLSQIVEGNGINPLLENIWMVTHPPLLFLGYSAALIPFAYAIMALWKRDFDSWLKPAFPWTIFSIMTLGGGILLGGAWAYESLTFGGFWAWDPVENASLIPWLFILAGFHMMILNKKRKHSYALSFLFVILGFVFVIYASYLTRSGVLGSTSAHAFGNNGLSTQMAIIIFCILFLSFYLYFRNLKNFKTAQVDRFLSREFWMYLGSLVLVLSSFQIFAATSIPVFNSILGTNIAPPEDPIAFYNKWQLPFAIFIMILMGGSLVLRYGKNDPGQLNKRFWTILLISAILYFGEIFLFDIKGWALLVFLLFINFAGVASFYLLFTIKNRAYSIANSLSHLGFAIFFIGVLVAFSNTDVITSNTSRFDLGDARSNKENQVLIKDQVIQLGDYYVCYDSLYRNKNHLYYTINFYNDADKKDLNFSIKPTINVNSRMGNVYNPSTDHGVKRDVFTFITFANLEKDFNGQKYGSLFDGEIQVGDTIPIDDKKLYFKDLMLSNPQDSIDINNLEVIAKFDVLDDSGENQEINCAYIIANGEQKHLDAAFNQGQYLVRFSNISAKPKTIKLSVMMKRMEFIVIKSTVFPWISLILIGSIIMFSGLFVSLWRHRKDALEH